MADRPDYDGFGGLYPLKLTIATTEWNAVHSGVEMERTKNSISDIT